MILPAQTIRKLSRVHDDNSLLQKPLLSPCARRIRLNGVTYGRSAKGYDLRIIEDIRIWPMFPVLVDSVETFNMPDDICGLLFTKSTWARAHVRV